MACRSPLSEPGLLSGVTWKVPARMRAGSRPLTSLSVSKAAASRLIRLPLPLLMAGGFAMTTLPAWAAPGSGGYGSEAAAVLSGNLKVFRLDGKGLQPLPDLVALTNALQQNQALAAPSAAASSTTTLPPTDQGSELLAQRQIAPPPKPTPTVQNNNNDPNDPNLIEQVQQTVQQGEENRRRAGLIPSGGFRPDLFFWVVGGAVVVAGVVALFGGFGNGGGGGGDNPFPFPAPTPGPTPVPTPPVSR